MVRNFAIKNPSVDKDKGTNLYKDYQVVLLVFIEFVLLVFVAVFLEMEDMPSVCIT